MNQALDARRCDATVIAYGMIHFLADRFGTPVVLAKISAETLLFVVNFVVQRDLVFQRNRGN